MVTIEFQSWPNFDPMFPGVTYCLFWSTTEDNKNLTINSGWHVKKKEISPCRNNKIGLIHTSRKLWRKILFVEEREFYHFNWRLMPQRAVKFVKPAKSQRQYLEFNKVTLFDGMMEQWNGGISFNAECLVVWKISATRMEFQWKKKLINN